MKTCVLCESEQPAVSLVQVVPASWTGFHGFVEICAECQASERFQKLIKQKKIVVAAAKPEAVKGSTQAAHAAPAAPKRSHPEARQIGPVEIAHRRTGALLQRVEAESLANACLPNAALSGAALSGAIMAGADLHRADLHLADLGGADLRRTDLREANLRGADLRGADLRDARLQRADLRHAVYDDLTRWPAGFDMDVCGAQREHR